jgi:uncharacterized damage-inducible protein DinB
MLKSVTAFQFRSPSRVYRVDKDSLTRLFSHHYRANHRLWPAVMALSDEQFTQASSNGDPSVQTQIVRMVANENLWVNYLWHGEVEFLQVSHIPTRSSIRLEWDALEEEICDFIDELSPAELERRVNPPFLNSGASLKVKEILLQIIYDAVESRARLRVPLRRMEIPTLTENQYLL